MEFVFGNEDLNLNQVQHIVRAMNHVAKVDGTHEGELVLLREFYAACKEEMNGLAAFDDLMAQPFDIGAAKEELNTDVLKAALVRSCLFLANADGDFSKKEEEAIQSMAVDLGLSEQAFSDLNDEINDRLLGELAHIRNMDALSSVADELKDRS